MANIVGASFGQGQRIQGVDLAFKDLYQRKIFDEIGAKLFIEYTCKDGIEEGCPLFIDHYFKNLKDLIVESHKQSGLTITIGGDHSVAMSTVYASNEAYDDLALIWIDAHSDYHDVLSTLTKNLHGFPLNAIVNGQKTFTGENDQFWLNSSISPSSPSFTPFSWMGNGCMLPNKIAIIGLRDVDPIEKQMLKRSGIHVYWMNDVRLMGIESVLKQAIAATTGNIRSTKIHISLDVDSMDPHIFPSTGCYCPHGLTDEEVKYIVRRCNDLGQLVALDLVEYNPLIKPDSECWKICLDILKQTV